MSKKEKELRETIENLKRAISDIKEWRREMGSIIEEHLEGNVTIEKEEQEGDYFIWLNPAVHSGHAYIRLTKKGRKKAEKITEKKLLANLIKNNI